MILKSKKKFHQHESPILKYNIKINKIAVSSKTSFARKGFKYSVGFKDTKKNRPSCIFLPKISAYRRDLDETKSVCFLIRDDELFVRKT